MTSRKLKARKKAIPTAEKEMISRFLNSARWAKKGSRRHQAFRVSAGWAGTDEAVWVSG